MKKFNKIAVINKIKITLEAKEKVQRYSGERIIYPEMNPKDEKEICERIGDADAVLGDFHSTITSSVLKNTPNLKYIGICGTNLKNVDLKAAKKHNIVVKNVTDYGDEATAEYIFAQLLNLFKGLGKCRWKNEPSELNSKTIGIVGLGAVGEKVAKTALGFNMRVVYYSNTRKPEWEKKGVCYLPMDQLFKNSDIISMNVPKDTKIIGKKELENMGDGKIIVDTCLGNIYKNINALRSWLANEDNFLIRDHHPEINEKLGDLDGFIYTENIIAGITKESRNLLSKKVIDNIEAYLKTA